LRAGAALVLAAVLSTGADAQAIRCPGGHEVMHAHHQLLDLMAYREACGVANPPALEAAVRRHEVAAAVTMARFENAAEVPGIGEEFRGFRQGRLRRYADEPAKYRATACEAAVAMTRDAPDAVLVAEIEAQAERIGAMRQPAECHAR